MELHIGSFLIGFTFAAALAVAWTFGEQRAIRLARRIARHGRDLDRVFFEDAEGDATITRPSPATAERLDFHRESQR